MKALYLSLIVDMIVEVAKKQHLPFMFLKHDDLVKKYY